MDVILVIQPCSVLSPPFLRFLLSEVFPAADGSMLNSEPINVSQMMQFHNEAWLMKINAGLTQTSKMHIEIAKQRLTVGNYVESTPVSFSGCETGNHASINISSRQVLRLQAANILTITENETMWLLYLRFESSTLVFVIFQFSLVFLCCIRRFRSQNLLAFVCRTSTLFCVLELKGLLQFHVWDRII